MTYKRLLMASAVGAIFFSATAAQADATAECNGGIVYSTSLECGANSSTLVEASTAVGGGAETGDSFTTAIGSSARAFGIGSTALGAGGIAWGRESIAIGSDSQVGNATTATEDGTAVGNFTRVLGDNGTAIGHSARSFGVSGSAVGANSSASGDHSSAFGAGAVASGTGSVALGGGSQAAGDASVAIGQGATASSNSVALGQNASNGGFENSVAIGTGTTNTAANEVHVGNRTVAGVAAGAVNATSTEAVNGSQLFAADQIIGQHTTQISTLDTRVSALEAMSSSLGALEGSMDILFDLRRSDRRDMKQGVAAAMAMADAPMPSRPGGVSYQVKAGTFRGEHAVSGALTYRLNTGSMMAVSAGVSYAGNKNNGVTVALSGEF